MVGRPVGRNLINLAQGLFIALIFLPGCGSRPPEPLPVEYLAGRLMEWVSPFSAPLVNLDLRENWKPVSEREGYFRAALPDRISAPGGIPEATVTVLGKPMTLGIYASLESIGKGEYVVDPGRDHVVPLTRALRTNGSTSGEAFLHGGEVRIIIPARGKIAAGIPPEMVVRFNGETLQTFSVANEEKLEPYMAAGMARDGTNVLEVEFTNDYWAPPEDRNLYLGEAVLNQSANLIYRIEGREAAAPDAAIQYRPLTEIVNRYMTLEPAKGLSEVPGPWHYYENGGDTRPALPLPPPGIARFEVVLERGMRLGISCALTEDMGAGVIFRIAVRQKGKETQLGELRPITNSGWMGTEYDLSAFRPGKAEILIRTVLDGRPQDGMPPLALLAEPVLYTGPEKKERPRNVILVSLDTLRADHLGCYGYKRNTSPNLDRFAAANVFFETPIVQSNWTLPAHVSMLTSLYPSAHGVFRSHQSARGLEPLALTLKTKWGFSTKAIVDGGFMSPEFGLTLGFHSYEKHNHTGFETVMPSAEKWLREEAREPFFFFLHTYDIHEPYEPPKRYRDRFPIPEGSHPRLADGVPRDYLGNRQTFEQLEQNAISEADLQQIVNMYDAGIMYVDDQMQILFNLLRELGYWENTLLIVTSDHGEEFLDHGQMGHGRTLFEEQIKVPLMMRVPGIGPKRITGLAEIIDLPPTILDFLGLARETRHQGLSLLAYLEAGRVSKRAAYAEMVHRVARRTEDAKVIYHLNTDHTRMYDLRRDPGEKSSIYWENQEAGDRVVVEIKRFREANEYIQAELNTATVDLSGALGDQLRNLGYLQ